MSTKAMFGFLVLLCAVIFAVLSALDHRDRVQRMAWWQAHSKVLVSDAPVTAVVAHEAHWKMGPYVDWVRVETADTVVVRNERALGCADGRALVGPGTVRPEEIDPLQALRGRTLQGVVLRVPQAADTFHTAQCPDLSFQTDHWVWHGKTVALLNPLAE